MVMSNGSAIGDEDLLDVAFGAVATKGDRVTVVLHPPSQEGSIEAKVKAACTPATTVPAPSFTGGLD